MTDDQTDINERLAQINGLLKKPMTIVEPWGEWIKNQNKLKAEKRLLLKKPNGESDDHGK